MRKIIQNSNEWVDTNKTFQLMATSDMHL